MTKYDQYPRKLYRVFLKSEHCSALVERKFPLHLSPSDYSKFKEGLRMAGKVSFNCRRFQHSGDDIPLLDSF